MLNNELAARDVAVEVLKNALEKQNNQTKLEPEKIYYNAYQAAFNYFEEIHSTRRPS